jgi:hypothetical protein
MRVDVGHAVDALSAVISLRLRTSSSVSLKRGNRTRTTVPSPHRLDTLIVPSCAVTIP